MKAKNLTLITWQDWMPIISVLLIVALLMLMSCSKTETRPMETDLDQLTVTECPYVCEADTNLLKSSPVNRMPNGGGKNTTDWLGSNVATGWHGANGVPSVFQILTMGKDRMQKVSSISQFVLYSPEPAQISEVYHTLSFQYMTNTTFIVVVRYTDHCGYSIYEGRAGSGWQNMQITFWSPRILSIMWYNHPNKPGWLVVDNVNLF